MFNILKLHNKRTNEKGQALILVLVLLTIGALLISGLLGFMGTGAKSAVSYINKTEELYSADAGIQDATWQIRYEHLNATNFPGPPAYDNYTYGGSGWTYTIPGVSTVNHGKSSTVTIWNEWMPSNFNNFTILTPTVAKNIVEGINNQLPKLMVTGAAETNILANDGITTISRYHIKITYYPVTGETFNVSSIGVWLPPGCTYFSDAGHTSDFENTSWSSSCQAAPASSPYKGSQSTVWSFNSTPAFTDFPNVTIGSPISMDAAFYFTPPPANTVLQPQAVAWIVPTGTITTGTPPIPVCWDADTRIFKLHSVSGGSTVDSYVAKAELRTLQSAMNGDYIAAGNTLERCTNGDTYGTRNTLDASSSSTISTIPTDAQVTAAYLYWSAWRAQSAVTSLFSDSCDKFFSTGGKFDNGTAWALNSGSFKGHNNTTMDLTTHTAVPLNHNPAYEAGSLIVSWDEWATVPAGTGDTIILPTADGSSLNAWNLAQIRPTTGDGIVSGTWTTSSGTKWAAVDECPWLNLPLDITNYKTCTAPGSALNTFSPFSVPSTATITNVVVYTNCQKSSSSTCTASATLRVGGTSYNTAITPTTSAAWYTTIWTNNPKSGTFWTPAQVNGTDSTNPLQQFGSSATAVTATLRVNAEYIVVNYTDAGHMFQNIDETGSTVDLTNVLVGTTATGGNQLFIAPVSIPNGARNIKVLVHYRACDYTTTAATNNIRGAIKVNGTLYYESSGNDPGISPLTTDWVATWTNNPATSQPWTVSDIENMGSYPLQQFGVYSSDLNPNVAVAMVYEEVTYDAPIDPTDGLDFSFYDGSAWSPVIHAFLGGVISYSSSTPTTFTYPIPSQYFTANFKIKLSLVNFSTANEYLNIDNIQIRYMQPDTAVTFKIAGSQVSFDSSNNPQLGGTVTSNKSQVLPNGNPGSPNGYSYSCYRDVTALVQKYGTSPALPVGSTNKPGNDIYTVGGAGRTTDLNNQWSYACWSIIVIYTSPATLGHQLYLYDTFKYADNVTDIQFGDMSAPYGGNVSGFIVPPRITGAITAVTLGGGGSGYTSPPAVNFNGGGGSGAAAMATISGGHVTGITIINGGSGYSSAPSISVAGGGGTGATATVTGFGDEVNVAKLTTAVADGDTCYTGDFIAFNAPSNYWSSSSSNPWSIPDPQNSSPNPYPWKLWDGVNLPSNSNTQFNPNNVWNSHPIDGLDIKTFNIPWDSNNSGGLDAGDLLHAGDTSAHIDIPTNVDSWNLIYIILSFRSVTTTGGSLSYLIH